MKLKSPLTKWGLSLLLILLSTFVYAAVDQGYEDANGVPGVCPTNGSAYTDAWGFSACNCTSYVAYRLRLNDVKHNNVLFTNTAWGVQWSNAQYWSDSTKLNAVGVRSDKYPAVGSVAQWNSNEKGMAAAGHVAYVQHLFTSPNDGKLTHIGVMQYNITPHLYTYKKYAVERTDYPPRFLHFEEKGRDADATNATCVSGLSSRPSGANVGTFCWKHASNTNASCSSGSAHYYYDYRTCTKHTVTSSTTPSKSTLCGETTSVSGTTGYTIKIGSGFPDPIDPTVLGTDFAMCQSGSSGSGTSKAVSSRLTAPRNKLWRDLSNTVLN